MTNTKTADQFNAAQFILQCGSKSSAIRKLAAQGKSRGEVAKMLGIRYQHVRNVLITPIKTERTAKVATGRKATDSDVAGL